MNEIEQWAREFPKLAKPKQRFARALTRQKIAVHGGNYVPSNGQRWERTRVPITTSGWLRSSGAIYHVYVGRDARGKIKIGMSANPRRRCKKDFGIEFVGAVDVTKGAAKEVETMALRLLGSRVGDGEWVWCGHEEALAAIRRARDEVGRFMHADPSLSPDEARKLRIAEISK